jgi:signal transduction histidine kinase
VPETFKTVADFYRIKRLSDILTEDEILVMTAGFSDQIDLPIVLVEFDRGGKLKPYVPFRFDQFLHKKCLNARKDAIVNCQKQEGRELRLFRTGEEPEPAGFCWNDGVHFRKGIKIGGIPVALAIGGGYRVRGDKLLSEEDRKCIWEVLQENRPEIAKSISGGCKFELEDRKGDYVGWDRYLDHYNEFKDTVALIEGIARDRFRSRRFDLESDFFNQIRPKTYGRSFHLPKEDKEFKEAYREAISEVNSFCGYSKTVITMYSKDTSLFRVNISTLYPGQERDIQSFQSNANWESCFKYGRVIYVEPDTDQRDFGTKARIDMKKLRHETQALFPFIPMRRCCIFPFAAEDRRWIFFFIYETTPPPKDDFFLDNRRFMEMFCSRVSNGMAHAYAEMDRRDYLDRVAHETMNPIAKVKWHAQFIKIMYDKIEKKVVNRKLDDIINECDRAVKAAETILELSGKIEIKLKLEKVNFFEKIAKPIVHEIRYGRKDLYIDYMDLVKMPILNIDFNLLYDVMFNILDNAVKYSSKHTTIVFSYGHQEDGIVICVSNIGIGIPEGEDEKIFKVGTRGSNASLVNVRGTGQGLAISKMNIEEKLGGRIWFQRGRFTEEGKEILFKVFLPKKYIAGGEYGKDSYD